MDPLVIDVDVRERRTAVWRLLARQSRVAVRIRFVRLEVADYMVSGVLGIERKRAPDLAASIVQRRLFRQAAGMSGLRHRLLVVEGLRWGGAIGGMGWEQIRGALLSLGVMFGVPTMVTADARETVEVILGAAGQLSRAGRRRDVRAVRGRKGARWALAGLPGIGSERAARLLARFGSLEEVLTAPEEALATVAGIGRATARTIRSTAAGAAGRRARRRPSRSH